MRGRLKLGVKRSGLAEQRGPLVRSSVSHEPTSPAATPPAWTEAALQLPAIPVLWAHAQVRKISESNFLLNYDYKSVFLLLLLSGKCYMCILLTCDWREENRPVVSPPLPRLLLQCIVCNAKLI